MAFLRRNVGLIIRTSLTVLFMVIVCRQVDWHMVLTKARGMEMDWMIPAFLLTIPVVIVTSWRWKMLLEVQGLKISLWRSIELAMIGTFFNSLLIGTTGGDVVKIFYVTRLMPKARSAAAFTVIQDRVIGLVALLVFGVILSLNSIPLFYSTPTTAFATSVFYFFAAGGVVASLGALAGPYFLANARFRQLLLRLPIGDKIGKLLGVYEVAARAIGVNLLSAVISISSHICTLISSYCVIRALHVSPDPLAFAAVVAVVNMLIALPTNVAGLGQREILFIKFLALFGVDQNTASTFSLSCFCMTLCWSIIGYLFYFLYRHETHDPAPNMSGGLVAEPGEGAE